MANIFVNREAVGTLTRDEPVNRFTYAAGVPAAHAVSLLMPVGAEPYFAERPGALHPIFDMSLPEGALRNAVSTMFAKALPAVDDLALFQVVGRSLIGRLRYGQSAAELDQVPPQNLRDLLESRGTSALFDDLLQRYAQYSGVSGVQPKFLVRDNGSLRTATFSPVETSDRLTAHGTTHIVKSFDPARYPGLAANELLCLRAAEKAGLSIARAELAADAGLLVVERFDLRGDGMYHAFEDGCALDGRLSVQKYEGSYEQLAATLASVLRGPAGTSRELAQFFRSLALSVAVRNGDAHRKNFGVIYDDVARTVALAPTFDVVTTVSYLPHDSLALTLDGTKRWPGAKRLVRFGVTRCQLAPAAAQTILAEVADAVAAVSADLEKFAELDSRAGETGARMRVAWADGVAALREK